MFIFPLKDLYVANSFRKIFYSVGLVSNIPWLLTTLWALLLFCWSSEQHTIITYYIMGTANITLANTN